MVQKADMFPQYVLFKLPGADLLADHATRKQQQKKNS